MATVITSRSESVLHYLNPVAMVRNLWQHRDLIRQFTRREIEGRYKGSFLGLFWSFVNPLVLLLIYTYVFGFVFKSRWPEGQSGSLGEFAAVIFCGLITYTIFSETISRASTLIVQVPNYVKKVVFPLELLPISLLGAALFQGVIGLFILVIVNLILGGSLHWTVIFVPLVILPMLLMCLGVSWFLASFGVFVRDSNYTVVLLVQVLFFLTPIFYSLSAVPEPARSVMYFNPLASVVENMRFVVLWGQQPNWSNVGIWIVPSVAVSLLGYAWFMKTKKAFADVI